MKKKIEDLTLKEMRKLCEQHTCVNCQIKDLNICATLYNMNLEREVEVDE